MDKQRIWKRTLAKEQKRYLLEILNKLTGNGSEDYRFMLIHMDHEEVIGGNVYVSILCDGNVYDGGLTIAADELLPMLESDNMYDILQ